MATKKTPEQIPKLARALAGALPIGGATAIEIINTLCGPSVRDWREAFYKSVLEEIGGPENMTISDGFITTVAMVTPHIDKTRSEEKIRAYKNLLKANYNSNELDEHATARVIRAIDMLSTIHFRVLRCLSEQNPTNHAIVTIGSNLGGFGNQALHSLTYQQVILLALDGIGSDPSISLELTTDFKNLGILKDSQNFVGISTFGKKLLTLIY